MKTARTNKSAKKPSGQRPSTTRERPPTARAPRGAIEPASSTTGDEDTYLSVAEVAAYLGVHEKQVYRLQKRGVLPGTRLTGKWLFPKSLVDEALVRSATPTRAPTANGAPHIDERALVWCGEDDSLVDDLCALYNERAAAPASRAVSTMERAISHLRHRRVSAALVEHAREDCRRAFPRELSLGFEGRSLVAVSIASRDLGIATRDRSVGLHELSAVRLGVRARGAGSRTLLEHRLLRSGLDPERALAGQPEVRTHRAAILGVVRGELDACFVPHHEAHAHGLDVSVVAPLELSLVIDAHALDDPRTQEVVEILRAPLFREIARGRPGLSLARAGAVEVIVVDA